MPVVSEGTKALTRGVPALLFEAISELPGLFSGEMDLTQLTASADEVEIIMSIKYSSGGTYRERARVKKKKSEATALGFTPIEQTYGYKLDVELLAGSPTSSANLEFKVNKSAVPA